MANAIGSNARGTRGAYLDKGSTPIPSGLIGLPFSRDKMNDNLLCKFCANRVSGKHGWQEVGVSGNTVFIADTVDGKHVASKCPHVCEYKPDIVKAMQTADETIASIPQDGHALLDDFKSLSTQQQLIIFNNWSNSSRGQVAPFLADLIEIESPNWLHPPTALKSTSDFIAARGTDRMRSDWFSMPTSCQWSVAEKFFPEGQMWDGTVEELQQYIDTVQSLNPGCTNPNDPVIGTGLVLGIVAAVGLFVYISLRKGQTV